MANLFEDANDFLLLSSLGQTLGGNGNGSQSYTGDPSVDLLACTGRFEGIDKPVFGVGHNTASQHCIFMLHISHLSRCADRSNRIRLSQQYQRSVVKESCIH